jgi:L-threonylcarbamoyladenylate synthase
LDKVTVILKPTRENLRRTAEAIKKGAIVIYPSESSYGFGCDLTNKKAVEEICDIKKRSKSKHLISLVPDLATAKKYGKVDKISEKLAEKFMPGPLTIVVKGRNGLNELNFRISDNRIARMLCSMVNRPIVSTSANFSDEEPIYDSQELEKFFGMVDIILDAGDLPKGGKPSTVVQVIGNRLKLHREGAIPKDKILNALKK